MPEFRHKALEEKYVEHMTKICDILSAFHSKEDEKKLEIPYDIAQMLNVLKTPNWKEIPPLNFYFLPLEVQHNEVTKILIAMRKATVLRCKYHIEENRPMQKAIIELITRDYLAQDLAGDALKRDQFIFLY